VFEVPARVVLGFFLLIENVLPYLIDQNAVGVAHGAHIGGFVAGVVFAWAIGRGDDAAEPEYLAPWQA
jgi:membrane associated rhomboid family serine protease